jgi:predicted Zn-dependent protease
MLSRALSVHGGVARAVLMGVVATAGLLAGCSTNPTTGRSQITGLGRNEEVAIGAAESPKLMNEMGGEVQNPALRAYINEVGQKLKAHTEVDGPQRTWYFTLIDSDMINAFALPGERVFMSRGLADKFTTEAQLAGVLGHEIGHVMARHTSERIGQAKVASGFLSVVGAVIGTGGGADLAMQGGQLIVGGKLLQFSREQESEADMLGVRYMTKAGYNPRGQLEVMEVLKQASGGGRGGTPEWLATHPLPQTRIDDIDRMLRGEYAYTQSGPQAASFQNYADQYRQRYLGVRASEPARPQRPTQRRSMLESIGDPILWCGVCRVAAQDELVRAHGHDHPRDARPEINACIVK